MHVFAKSLSKITQHIDQNFQICLNVFILRQLKMLRKCFVRLSDSHFFVSNPNVFLFIRIFA